MKRFHVHVAVDNLTESTRFYSAMFGAQPSVEKNDYAKWMLDDPRINFAISTRGNQAGVNHLGFQAENAAELADIHARLREADSAIVAEEGTNCCYAKSDKYWVTDPSGIAWESFHTLDSIPTFGGVAPITTKVEISPTAIAASACCAPAMPTMPAVSTTPSPTKGACCG
jgi:catechol 2,3-dioxygenase-like lactoylglutathione lyase family enzyme